MKRILLACIALSLASCASPGVIQTGPNQYMLSRIGAGGMFSNTTKLKYDVIREANEYAAARGKIAEGIVGNETPPAPGRMPSFEYQFRLADPKSQGTDRKAFSASSVRMEIDP